MFTVVLSAVLMGMIFSLHSGALLAQTLRQGLQQGFLSALFLQFGWLLGIAAWAVLDPDGTPLMFDNPKVPLLSLIYIPYLIWLGVGSLRDAWHPPVADMATKRKVQTALVTGVALSMSNPMHIVVWGAMTGDLWGMLKRMPSLAEKLIFYGCGVMTSVICCFAIAGLMQVLYRKMPNRWKRIGYGGCGVILLCLAGWGLVDASGAIR